MTAPLTRWLDEMEAKCRAATPGPWEAHDLGPTLVERPERKPIAVDNWSDAAYIAALPPETIQALLECVRALEYYAECSNYERREMLGGTRPPAVLVERGSRATAALARLRRLAGREG